MERVRPTGKTSCVFSEYKRTRPLHFGGDSAEKPPFTDDGTYQGGENDVMWKLNDGYEIKAFRKGDELLTPVIQTLVKMKDAMQSGDQKHYNRFRGK